MASLFWNNRRRWANHSAVPAAKPWSMPLLRLQIVGGTRYRPTIVILTGGPAVQCPCSYFSHPRSSHDKPCCVSWYSEFSVLLQRVHCPNSALSAHDWLEPTARQSGAFPAKSNLAHCALVCLGLFKGILAAAKLHRKLCGLREPTPWKGSDVKEAGRLVCL